MKKVLLTDPIAPAGYEILKKANLEIIDLTDGTIEQILDVVGTVHGWIIRSGTTVDAELLNRADNLQVVGRAGVGIDNIDIDVATLRGVVVMNTPDGNTISAAEHTLAMMMASARNVHLGHSSMATGAWDRKILSGVELHGKTLGLVGLGRIGRRVMGYGRALGMDIIAYDPYVPLDLAQSGEVEMVDLDALLARADFVSLHVPMTDDTRNIIDESRLKLMKPTARLINCARGGLINEEELVAALNDGTIAGAAIDVYSSEPLSADHPLRTAPNIVLTPHLGASTKEAQEGVALAICTQVADYLSTGELIGALNMPVGDMEMLKRLDPFLTLSKVMGQILWQITSDPIIQIEVTCNGEIESPELLSLSAVRGVLEHTLDTRLNFVNTGAVAAERGIRTTHKVDTGPIGYSNQITVEVSSKNGKRSLVGSVFGGQHPRIVEIEGYHLELNPEGVMLFIRNLDAPGVLGRIGNALGKSGINIGSALLSRERKTDGAFLVVKIDSDLPSENIKTLEQLEGIVSVQKVTL